tara:strand:- start:1105 stop:1350 length:246 start_codon:yes stop_codon:yes gene_type:complete
MSKTIEKRIGTHWKFVSLNYLSFKHFKIDSFNYKKSLFNITSSYPNGIVKGTVSFVEFTTRRRTKSIVEITEDEYILGTVK